MHSVNSEIDRLRESMYLENEYYTSIGIAGAELEWLNKILSKIQDDIRNKVEKIASSSHVNPSDFEKAKQIIESGAQTIVGNINQNPPVATKDDSLISQKTSVASEVTVTKADFMWTQNDFCQTVAPSLLAGMSLALQRKYLYLFLTHSARYNFNIDFDQIPEALERLGLKDDTRYVILPVDAYIPPLSDGYRLRPSLKGRGFSQIIIMPGHQLPSANLVSAVDTTLEENDQNEIITMSAKVDVCIDSLDRMDYLRLLINNSILDGKRSQLNELTAISSLLPVQIILNS